MSESNRPGAIDRSESSDSTDGELATASDADVEIGDRDFDGPNYEIENDDRDEYFANGEESTKNDGGNINKKTVEFIFGDIPQNSFLDEAQKNSANVDTLVRFLMQSTSGSQGEDAAESPSTSSASPPHSRKRQRMVRSKLPKTMQGLMGEANMKYARGEYEEVIVMCKEIIRSVPNAPEPYQTLSMLYEELGDTENAYQFGLIAAHLDPKNTEEWLRLAEMAFETGNLKDSAFCYRRAAKCDRENLQLLFQCVQLESQLGEYRKACETMTWILDSAVANADSNVYMSVVKDLAKLHHQKGKIDRAIQVLEMAIEKHPEFLTSEEVNLLAEFYVVEKNFNGVIKILEKHCGVICSCAGAHEVNNITVPAELPVDLRSKLIVAVTHLQYFEVLQGLLLPMKNEDVEEVGDLFLDMSEAFHENGYFGLSLPLLTRLVKSNNYNLAAVWLRYAECLSSLGSIKEAVTAYSKVVEMAPNHVSARVQLSLLQQQLGLDNEALTTLAEGGVPVSSVRNDWSDLEGKEPRLLLHTCLLLHTQSKFNEFFRYVQYLLFGQLPPHIIKEHEYALMNALSKKSKVALMHRVLPDFDEYYKTAPAMKGGDNSITEQECWNLFTQACETASKQQQYGILFTLVKSAMSSYMFMSNKTYTEDVEFKCICCHILLKYGGSSFDLIRDHLMKHETKEDGSFSQYHNLFSNISCISPHDVRFSRFCERLLRKHPKSVFLNMAHGHSSIVFGSYRSAIKHYMTVYNEMQDSPLLNLIIGLCFLHIVCMKFTTQRATLAVQAICFLDKYVKLRGKCQETYYNIGRAMQQISMNAAAVYFYEKCLNSSPPIDGESFDLKREAAFNLALIYRNSGSLELSEHTIRKYCVI